MKATDIVKAELEKETSYKDLIEELAEIAADARKKGFKWAEIQAMFRKYKFVVSVATLRRKIKEKKALA